MKRQLTRIAVAEVRSVVSMASLFEVLLTLTAAFVVVNGSVSLPAENCRPRPTVVSVDSSNHSYLPYFVTLDRCSGSVGAVKPSLKTCVAAAEAFLNVSVIDTGSFSTKILHLANHTACEAQCVKSKEDCDLRYQTWDSHSCACQCRYVGEPAQSPCASPLAWNQASCSCQCPLTTRACPSNKEWRHELCGCACKTTFSLRCAQQNYILNPYTCQCVPPPTLPTSGGRSGSGSGVSVSVVVAIVIVEFMVIVGVFFLLHVYCKRRSERRTKFWSTASRPQRWFIKRKNAYHVDQDPPGPLEEGEGAGTETPDEREDFELHDDYMKSEHESSETEIFYESHGWHAETEPDRLSRDSMQESEDARITRV